MKDDLLSPREREIVLLRERGLAAKQIAAEIGISVHTVSSHLRSVFRKTKTMGILAALWKLRICGQLPCPRTGEICRQSPECCTAAEKSDSPGPDGDSLTRTQKRVADLIWDGRSNKQIAADLDRKLHTIDLHVCAILKRLKLQSRTQLVRFIAEAYSHKKGR